MPRVGRLIRGTGILTIAALALSACGGPGFDQSAATKVIQSVDVNLDQAGAITEVASNAVYLDELSGKSDNSTETFTIEDVVDDLPVRVSTQYKTDDGAGSDLAELEGHSGRVEIAVTVENLTLNSTELTYDVAGESRESSALIGTPLSVAGSVELQDTAASNVVVDVEADTTTNGVVSQTTDGDAVVQWGTVLAPPQSEATTTFRLVADVDDFSAPEFDLAVQAGFHTDMSFEGMLSSALDTSSSSEYAMQRKAIELVAEINEVLTRAGTTITEIRQNLDHTTDTLGVDAAQQLRQNSDDMVTEMQRVGEQLAALESQVEGSMSGAETAMNSQLTQIVASMNGMMGNTEASAPKLVTGQGCAATVEDAEANGSLYSTFLILGAQLDGYAEANAECRNEVVSEIQNTLGPEIPDAEICENESSITCTLFDAQVSVQDSLSELVEKGKANLEAVVRSTLNGENNEGGVLAESKQLEAQLIAVDGLIDGAEEARKKLEKGHDDAVSDFLATQEEAIKALEAGHDGLSEFYFNLRSTISNAKSDLESSTTDMREQQTELAGELCTLKLHQEDPNQNGDENDNGAEQNEDQDAPEPNKTDPKIEELRAQLVDTDCLGEVKDDDELPSKGTLVAQLDQQLEAQKKAWDTVYGKIKFDARKEDLERIEQAIEKLEANNFPGEDGARKLTDSDDRDEAEKSLSQILEDLKRESEAAKQLHSTFHSTLDDLDDTLIADANQEFDKFENDTSKQLPKDIDKQVRVVTDRLNNARDSVTESYNTTISGLATTSDAVVHGTANQLNEQKATLEEQQESTTEALNKSTTTVLESIHESTTSSTRDLEGASAQLGASLTNVILDLGDPNIQGSGILGSMSASSAMSDTADYQLALASQRAAGYANVRSEDIAEIMLRQAQFSASLEAASTLPAFHLDVPSGARTHTIYAFRIGGSK